jgi:CRP-like cAMP-binding protein
MSLLEAEFLVLAYAEVERPIDILDQIYRELKFFKRFEKKVRLEVIADSRL